MRLWAIHPKYLDAKGLVALWRESLLAQKVLLGETAGYRHHPQLLRFKESGNAVGAIATYLRAIAEEAQLRNYRFDSSKIVSRGYRGKIEVTSGQLKYELSHLLGKLKVRDVARYDAYASLRKIAAHPSFVVIKGPVASWEVK